MTVASASVLLLVHNPWLAEPARQAELVAKRLPETCVARAASVELRSDRVVVVVGPRQAGKSTLLMEAALRHDRPLVLVNAEEPAFRELCRSPAGFLHWLREEVVDVPATLLFEEIQHLAEAGLFLKGLVDLHTPHLLAATGSASYHLRARTRESLAGRADRITLLPFSHAELLGHERPVTRIAAEQEARRIWERHLRFGGYPEVWLADRPEAELARLVEAFLIRDASDLFRVTNLDGFRTVLRLAAADTGSLVNLSAWAAEAGIARDTASRYLDLLEKTHVVRRLRPFLGGRRAEIKAARKVYFLDCGLRNAVFGGFAPAGERADGGALAETFVAVEVARHLGLTDKLAYWRTRNGAEVDFVVERGGRLLAIEVKLGALRRRRIPRSAREFIKAYHPDALLMVNAELRETERVEGVEVRFCRPWEVASILTAW